MLRVARTEILFVLIAYFALYGESCPPTSLCSLEVEAELTLSAGVNLALSVDFGDLRAPDPDRIALFNSSDDVCEPGGYNNGYACHYIDIRQINRFQGIFNTIIECRDAESLSLPSGRLVLAFHMSTVGTPVSTESDCEVLKAVNWIQTPCIIEEFHLAIEDECSGITDVLTRSGTNETVFVVNVTGVRELGRAVLLSNTSYFCGNETFMSAEDSIPCSATRNLTSLSNLTMSIPEIDEELDYVYFKCEGDATRFPMGLAWIVFERILEPALVNESCHLEDSRPFMSNYSGFEITWLHSRVPRLSEDDSGEDDSGEDELSPTVLCGYVDSENLVQCLNICVSDVDNPKDMTAVIEICEKVVYESLSHIPLRSQDLDIIISILNALGDSTGPATVNSSIRILDDLIGELQKMENLPILTADSTSMVVNVFDRLLADDRRDDWFALLQDQSSAGAFLWSLEQTAFAISMALNDSGALDMFIYTGDNIPVMMVSLLQAEDYLTGVYHFPRPSQFVGADTMSTGIEIPLQLLCDSPLSPSRSPNNTGSSYSKEAFGSCPAVISSISIRNLPTYLDQAANSDSMIGSFLLSAQVVNSPNNLMQIQTQPIRIHFSPSYDADNFTNETCVFWDFALGDWSSNGVDTEVDEDGNVVCISTHLTSFAVLVDVNGPEISNAMETFALMIVTYAGCGISLLCLLMALLIFVTCGKNLNKGVLLYIHANFVIALSLGLLTFIAGIETAVEISWLCTVVAALLHYLFLCVFCWMLAEGIMLYLLVVRVFGTTADKWYYLIPLGWGLPVPIVGISVAVRHEEYGTENFCWLSTQSGIIWAFVGPMLFVLAVNSVILVLTLYHMVRGRRYRGAEGGVRNIQLVKTALKGLVILLPLLGMTWVIGLLAVNQNTTVFAWIFTILNSLQGCFIFIFHVLRNDKVWDTVKRWIRCLVPVTGMERKETLKEMSSNMPTGETSDGMDLSSPDSERVTTTQYRLQTFDRTFSGTSQDSSSGLFSTPVVSD